jgi:hypothetical protein
LIPLPTGINVATRLLTVRSREDRVNVAKLGSCG